jgi:hypothetical protein
MVRRTAESLKRPMSADNEWTSGGVWLPVSFPEETSGSTLQGVPAELIELAPSRIARTEREGPVFRAFYLFNDGSSASRPGGRC